jgi:competence protein ComEC
MRNRTNKFAVFITVLFILLGISGCGTINTLEFPNDGLTVHYIDVGQADAALIECNGEAMMIDGGNVSDSSLIVSYLKKEKIEKLKYVIGTHAHEDHIGGLAGVFSKYEADNILCSQTSYDTKAFENFKKYAKKQGKNIIIPEIGDILTLGKSQIKIIGPVDKKADEINNRSIVIKLTYGNTSFLFEGDAEYDEEHDILNYGEDLFADVLKVGHHGSRTSTSYSYLREVMPDYAIISCGKKNDYGHPHEETLSRLNDAGAKIYRTDIQGTIVVKSDGSNIIVQTEK